MRPQIVDTPLSTISLATEHSQDPIGEDKTLNIENKHDPMAEPQDAFGNEELAEVRHKVLKWWYSCPNSPFCCSVC